MVPTDLSRLSEFLSKLLMAYPENGPPFVYPEMEDHCHQALWDSLTINKYTLGSRQIHGAVISCAIDRVSRRLSVSGRHTKLPLELVLFILFIGAASWL